MIEAAGELFTLHMHVGNGYMLIVLTPGFKPYELLRPDDLA